MKQLVILSGKGGSGKTTVAAALAHLASRESSLVLADADVDAANLELVVGANKLEEHAFVAGGVALIEKEMCTACGTCARTCRFDAVIPGDAFRVDPTACEGCAACVYQCPEDAIQMTEVQSGVWFRSDSRFGPLFHAHLFAGQENSGKLVTAVKQAARDLALETSADWVFIDGPPGIGCPVISACSGADMALLVVEPTVSGVHDLERMMATTDFFGVPNLVVMNKADLNLARVKDVESYCAERDVPMVGRIPYDLDVTRAMVQAQPVTAYSDGAVTQSLRGVWDKVRQLLAGEQA